MIIGAAILSILIGMSDGPEDLLSSSKRSIVMSCYVGSLKGEVS